MDGTTLLAAMSKPETRTDTRLLALTAQRDMLWHALKEIFRRVDLSLVRDENIYWAEQPNIEVREQGTKLTLAFQQVEMELAALEAELEIPPFVPSPSQYHAYDSTIAIERIKDMAREVTRRREQDERKQLSGVELLWLHD